MLLVYAHMFNVVHILHDISLRVRAVSCSLKARDMAYLSSLGRQDKFLTEAARPQRVSHWVSNVGILEYIFQWYKSNLV